MEELEHVEEAEKTKSSSDVDDPLEEIVSCEYCADIECSAGGDDGGGVYGAAGY